MATVKLNQGNLEMPVVGLGTWQSKPGEVGQAVEEALKAGYKHIDCAKVYQNQKEIGEAIKKSGVPREEIFITSKLFNNQHKPELVEASLRDCVQELGTTLDLYLMHWPVAFETKDLQELFPADAEGNLKIDTSVSIVDTWKAMVKLLDTGLTKAVGVSNFEPALIDKLIEATGVVPAVNQVEMHPRLPQKELIKYCNSKGIIVTAYSPLGNNLVGAPLLTEHPTIKKLAEAKGATPAQILISWVTQTQGGGHVVIPKSVNPERLRKNHELVELSAEDLKAIDVIGEQEPHRFCAPAKFRTNVFDDMKDQQYNVVV